MSHPFNQPMSIASDITSNIITTNNSGRLMPIDAHLHAALPINDYISSLKKNNLMMFLKILVLEGKFTREETVNILNMLESNDEASKELGATILKNEGYEHIL
jgi:hypothetical protein